MSERGSTWLDRARHWGPKAMAGLFGASGVVHLVRPGVFTPMIPSWLPAPTGLVYASGLAELACALGLVRRGAWAGTASAAVLVAVFPGNAQMAKDVWGDEGSTVLLKTAVLVRLPMQLPMIWAALQVGADERARVR